MREFDKECPVCKKRFSSLIEYTEHLGKDHADIPPDKILHMNKETKWNFGR